MKSKISKAVATVFVCAVFLLAGNNGYPQTTELGNSSVNNVNAESDTVRFDFYGVKKPQVESSVTPLEPLPLPERIKPSQDVLIEYGLPGKNTSYKNYYGTKYFGDATVGSHSYGKVAGSVIHGGKDRGFALDLKSLIAREHTPENLAPSVQEMSFRGNLETGSGDFGLNLGLAGHSDNIPDSGFRPGSRKAGLFSAGGSVKRIMVKKWEFGGGIALDGGSYDGFGFNEGGNEFGVRGNISAFGDFGSFYLGMNSSIENYSIAGKAGSIFTAGFNSGWLLFDRISVKPGGDLSIFDVPGKPARGRFYPKIGIDAVLTQNTYLKLNIAPSLRTSTFRELFQQNGLIDTPVPLAVEDRKNEVNGELGINLLSGASVSVGGYCAKTGDYPVFSRSGDYFSLSTVKEVTLYGAEMKMKYLSGEYWGTEGSIKLNGSDWDYKGKVPYIPSSEGILNAFYRINSLWKMRGTLSYYGAHYVETGLSEKQKSFATADIGFDRRILNDSAALSVEIRNITNSKGAWWAGRYKSPGTGCYAGFRIMR